MSFVEEVVDAAKYKEICTTPVLIHGQPYIPRQWVVDDAAKAFAANIGYVREMDCWRYVFWWRGAYFLFDVDIASQTTLVDGAAYGRICWIVTPIKLPLQMAGHADEVRGMVEEALSVDVASFIGPAKLFFKDWEMV